MKARCHHGAPWFRECPWCRSEADSAFFDALKRVEEEEDDRDNLYRYAIWRNMTAQDVQNYIDRAAVVVRLRQLWADIL